MENTTGNFIKIDRKILDWEWYKNTNTKSLFIHCLLKANWKDGKFEGCDIPRGSFVSSYPILAQQVGMTMQQVRTAINHLKSTGELTVKPTSKFSIYTVVNYELYQENNRQINRQSTGEQQASNRQSTTIEEYKEYKEIEEYKKETPKGVKKKFFPPSVEEVNDYCRERGNGIDGQVFVDFYASKGWLIGKNKMKDWRAAVRTWERKERERQPQQDIEDDRTTCELTDADIYREYMKYKESQTKNV